MRVTLTDVTQGSAAVNLAGPRRARSWGRLTDLDCSNEAFAYLDAKRARVAGVPSLILRIGFVGEVGYEIHFPAAYGQDVWDAILDAGAQDGIRPFGLEPQRILRLQKLHILVGQDTDSESTPVRRRDAVDRQARQGRGLHRQVGARARRRASERDGARRLHAARRRRPDRGRRGARRRGEPVGQVTSARHSRQLGQVIGMAWVPAALAATARRSRSPTSAGALRAQVMTRPFYDPDGEVLRS
jgi:sarcosine oxidase subunit alpha